MLYTSPMQAKVAQNIPNAAKWIGIGSTAMMLFVAAGKPSDTGGHVEEQTSEHLLMSCKANCFLRHCSLSEVERTALTYGLNLMVPSTRSY